MTGAEMRSELAAALGNRTDLTDSRLLQWMNWALLDLVGMHRKKLFTPPRFHVLEKKTVFKIYPVTAGIVSGSNGTYVINVTSSDVYTDYTDMALYVSDYNGTAPDGMLEQDAVIFSWDSGTNTVVLDREPDIEFDSDTIVSIRPRYVSIQQVVGLDPDSEIWALERIEHVDDGDPLDGKDWDALVGVDFLEYGSPGAFSHRGDSLLFDVSIEETESLRLWYYSYPTLFTEDGIDQECILPVDWHEVVLMGAIFRGHTRLMEPDRAAEARNEYIDMAVNKRTAVQIADDSKEQRGLRLRVGR